MNKINRRTVLQGTAILAGGVAGARLPWVSEARAQAAANPVPEVRALFFDVFGTVVDWRTGVAREVRTHP